MVTRGATQDGVVIVGGGLAGQRCAETLRSAGYEAPIRLVCGESRPPYDRPPLSKQVLTGSVSESAIAYRPQSWYERNRVDLILGQRADRLEPGLRRVTLSGGRVLAFDWLLIATGSRARHVPGLPPSDRVSTLRSLDDALRLREALGAGRRLAVVGAGFIGQEVAAAARALGVQVHMIEAAERALGHILGPQLGDWFTGLHRSEGVEFHTSCTVQSVADNGSVRLALSSGATVVADHVVVGVGVEPDVSWLAGSGIEIDGGVLADPHGRTACSRVLAAGDAAAAFDSRLGRHVPGSHWEAAGRQGARAARVMLGLDPGPVPLTSFWTDQYGVRIQYLGHAPAADALRIDGDPEERSFTVLYTRAGRAVAALLVNRPRQLPAARALIEGESK